MNREELRQACPEPRRRAQPERGVGGQAEVLTAHIAAFRASGAWKADPVRFRFLESLSERMQAQPEAVRAVLEVRLRGAFDEFTQFVVVNVPNHVVPLSVQAEPLSVQAEPVEARPSPLASLTAHLRSATPRGDAFDTDAPDELASARRFRQSWESGRTLDRLQQALDRSPANAGPLNSHALVVRSLAVMGDASVDYLRRFLAYVETLQWLEGVKQQMPQGKGGKTAPRRKKGRA